MKILSTPYAITALAGTDTTQLATTAFVKAAAAITISTLGAAATVHAHGNISSGGLIATTTNGGVVVSSAAGALSPLELNKSTTQYLNGNGAWSTPPDTNTITSINGKTGVIAKADIVALGVPAQDTIVDISGKADKTQVLTNVPANAKFTDTVYSHPTTAGNKHVPTGGASGQILRYSASGTAIWDADNDTITTVNGKTGTITKADITALGIPAQDTVVDISGKADTTYVDDKVKTDVPVGAKFTDTVYTHPASHPASMITDLPTGKKAALCSWNINRRLDCC